MLSTLPPIRQLILPDPGYVLFEGDFERADAQFVAWYADEPELKAIFQAGHDIYTEEARIIHSRPITLDERQRMKNGTHLTNYGGKARTLASTLGVTVAQAEQFQARWFSRFPGVKRWHRQVYQKLQLSHSIHNVWGFRRFYFERVDEHLLPQALAWLGQSGTAVTINKAMLEVRKLPQVQLLLQIHDSLLGQVLAPLAQEMFPHIVLKMMVQVPFLDPLCIPVSLKWSDRSWGHMEKWVDAAAQGRLKVA